MQRYLSDELQLELFMVDTLIEKYIDSTDNDMVGMPQINVDWLLMKKQNVFTSILHHLRQLLLEKSQIQQTLKYKSSKKSSAIQSTNNHVTIVSTNVNDNQHVSKLEPSKTLNLKQIYTIFQKTLILTNNKIC